MSCHAWAAAALNAAFSSAAPVPVFTVSARDASREAAVCGEDQSPMPSSAIRFQTFSSTNLDLTSSCGRRIDLGISRPPRLRHQIAAGASKSMPVPSDTGIQAAFDRKERAAKEGPWDLPSSR